MDLKTHDDDILPHIDAGKAPAEGRVALSQEPPSDTLEAKTAVSDSCVTLFSFAGASLKVCFHITGDNITVTVDLSTPFGNITIGKAVINASNPTVKLGGGVAGFKAEATISYDVAKSTLTISGKICAPFAGCKSGSTTIHL